MRRLHRARGLQCGYRTPGMVMATVALLAKDPDPGDATIRRSLAGNLCRCGRGSTEWTPPSCDRDSGER